MHPHLLLDDDDEEEEEDKGSQAVGKKHSSPNRVHPEMQEKAGHGQAAGSNRLLIFPEAGMSKGHGEAEGERIHTLPEEEDCREPGIGTGCQPAEGEEALVPPSGEGESPRQRSRREPSEPRRSSLPGQSTSLAPRTSPPKAVAFNNKVAPLPPVLGTPGLLPPALGTPGLLPPALGSEEPPVPDSLSPWLPRPLGPLPPKPPLMRRKSSSSSSSRLGDDVEVSTASGRRVRSSAPSLSGGHVAQRNMGHAGGKDFPPIEELLQGRSLMMFSRRNRFRVFLGKVGYGKKRRVTMPIAFLFLWLVLPDFCLCRFVLHACE